MALTLTLDHALPELAEPGFWKWFSTRALSESGNPSDDASQKGIWRDEPTRTIMLRPLQLDPSWLNTTQQLQDSNIIRLAHMSVHPNDITNQSIFEAPVGNTTNPYIWHVPVGPASFFPSMGAPGDPVPGAPSLTGVSVPADATAGDSILRVPNVIYEGIPIMNDPADPDPAVVEIGDTTDGKYLAHSTDRQSANAALFFRWHHPAAQLGFPCTYRFYVGQYRLHIKDVVVEIFRDTSEAGDRTAFQKVMTAPLWSVGDYSPRSMGGIMSVIQPEDSLAHDRSLLWLPYRRHQVLLYSNTGKWAVLTVRPFAKRLADDSDWDITREDTVLVWVQTPAPGRFQVQKVQYPSGTKKVQTPTVKLDYTPSVAPVITISKDSDHGSTLTAARTQPPAYTLPTNDDDDCPPPTTDPTTDQSRTYGIELSLTASTDRRRTPFFYGFEIAAARTFTTRPTTPFSIGDSAAATYYIQEAEMSAGIRPGEGRLSRVKVIDRTPFTLDDYYYRSYMPVQLISQGTAVFTGWTDPNEVRPLKQGHTREITFSAVDRWKQLSDTFLQDQRDWTDYGHIDVVLFVAQQGGVDTTGAETPAFTPSVKTGNNTPLGLGEQTIAQQAEDVKRGWQPHDDDTAASYILRVAEKFSGWDVGFYPSGQFYYRPRDFHTASSVTFQQTTAGGTPKFYESQWRTIEPEANVIQVVAGSAKDGSLQRSGLWVDWASIRNPAAVNYLGKWRAEVVVMGGTFTCKQLNYMARTIFQQTRRRRFTVEFTADFVPTLTVGRVCTLGTYGDYRITSYQAEFRKDHLRRASYTGELLESGYNT